MSYKLDREQGLGEEDQFQKSKRGIIQETPEVVLQPLHMVTCMCMYVKEPTSLSPCQCEISFLRKLTWDSVRHFPASWYSFLTSLNVCRAWPLPFFDQEDKQGQHVLLLWCSGEVLWRDPVWKDVATVPDGITQTVLDARQLDGPRQHTSWGFLGTWQNLLIFFSSLHEAQLVSLDKSPGLSLSVSLFKEERYYLPPTFPQGS